MPDNTNADHWRKSAKATGAGDGYCRAWGRMERELTIWQIFAGIETRIYQVSEHHGFGRKLLWVRTETGSRWSLLVVEPLHVPSPLLDAIQDCIEKKQKSVKLKIAPFLKSTPAFLRLAARIPNPVVLLQIIPKHCSTNHRDRQYRDRDDDFLRLSGLSRDYFSTQDLATRLGAQRPTSRDHVDLFLLPSLPATKSPCSLCRARQFLITRCLFNLASLATSLSQVFVVRLAVLKRSTIIGKLAILLENDNFVRKDPLNDLAAPESLYRACLIQDVINIAAFNKGDKSEGLSQVGCTPSSYRTGAHDDSMCA
ncbi:hypothetical protein C8J56DRAFT_1174941 [Mycena floridula]|nr:hypothetical protein C8J56DRAFT_1174941 [Mycena floridula]